MFFLLTEVVTIAQEKNSNATFSCSHLSEKDVLQFKLPSNSNWEFFCKKKIAGNFFLPTETEKAPHFKKIKYGAF
ncbi:hypothetical protein NEPTK9_001205 [Candidatus Neptunochlamydia vexilliferae]|uniref:Uncharacterized protein n=1 Tax=Candidatus Neptunichlamydia vexilliferae TaxID=1651774 RepID=A0ABS0AZY1_9BACT|nr:hypothetical protein [Candidatus Neptunochlamydia vexilliferae]